MNREEMQAIVDACYFPGFAFSVIVDGRGAVYLQGSYVQPDIITSKPEVQKTRRWFLSPAMVKSEIVQTVFKCVLTSVEHQAREHFKYKGERIFGPHYDVEALVDVCKAKRLDYRGRRVSG